MRRHAQLRFLGECVMSGTVDRNILSELHASQNAVSFDDCSEGDRRSVGTLR
jgi:hypothetical protein